MIDEPSTSEESTLPEIILEKTQEDTSIVQTSTSAAETVLVDVVQPITQVHHMLWVDS